MRSLIFQIKNNNIYVLGLTFLLLTISCNKSPVTVENINQYLDGTEFQIFKRTPPGDNFHKSEEDIKTDETFVDSERVVLSTFYYWFDQENELNSNFKQDQPIDPDIVQYDNEQWLQKELENFIKSGIDVILPVYWGDSTNLYWSNGGVKVFINQFQNMELLGFDPSQMPKVGMFYDVNSLLFDEELLKERDDIDLNSVKGRQILYRSIRDFFTLIPHQYRARFNKKLLVWFSGKEEKLNLTKETLDYINSAFINSFGGEGLYFVFEESWGKIGNSQFKEMSSLNGIQVSSDIISFGPGFNDGQEIVDREDGRLYSRNWNEALNLLSDDDSYKFVFIESWNNFNLGNEITESIQFRDDFIDSTTNFMDIFHDLYGKKTKINTTTAFISFEDGGDQNGITYVPQADGTNEIIKIDGFDCLSTIPNQYGGHFQYFFVEDSFKDKPNAKYTIQVLYYDISGNGLAFDYDSWDPSYPVDGAYKRSAHVSTTGTYTWKLASFPLPDGRFENRENGNADFRLAADDDGFILRRLIVKTNWE